MGMYTKIGISINILITMKKNGYVFMKSKLKYFCVILLSLRFDIAKNSINISFTNCKVRNNVVTESKTKIILSIFVLKKKQNNNKYINAKNIYENLFNIL